MTVLVFILSLLGAMALGMPLAFSLIVSGWTPNVSRASS